MIVLSCFGHFYLRLSFTASLAAIVPTAAAADIPAALIKTPARQHHRFFLSISSHESAGGVIELHNGTKTLDPRTHRQHHGGRFSWEELPNPGL